MSAPVSAPVETGLARLCQDQPARLRQARLGLLCNPASCLPGFRPAPEALSQALPGRLAAIFGPQHGFFADRQDNMVESDHGVHPRLGLPVYSLYGQTRHPTPQMLAGLDALLVDLPDMGCRVYTFFSTLAACLEQCAAAGVAVWVLDRPNPLGRGQEGPVLPPELFSFVGVHEMPLRHGLSLGELARLFAGERGLDLELEVVEARGWDGGDFAGAGLPWIMPSPNLPFLDSARVYPGQVLLEGTTLSEGRGTTRPFEICGAPGIDPWEVAARVEPQALAGAVLRPLFFEPTFHKFAGQTCGGWQIHVTDPARYRPLRLSCALLSAINRAHPGLWDFRPPPYEYEHTRRPLDLLLGDPAAAECLHRGEPALALEEKWRPGLETWLERAGPYLLYPA